MKERRTQIGSMVGMTLLCLLGVAGCGKALRSDAGGKPSAIYRVTVAPTADGTVRAGESIRYVAVASTAQGQPISTTFSWAVEPQELGSVLAVGSEAIFTGKKPGTGKIIAIASNGVRGESPVTVIVGPIANLRVEAQHGKTTLEAGETEHFIVTGEDLGQNIVGQSRSRVLLTPIWSVLGGIGTITPEGDFTAAGAGIGKSGQIVATVDDLQGAITVSVVMGSRAVYVGAETCKGCHAGAYEKWKTSNHSMAYDRLKSQGRMSASCLPCHVVGLHQGGFVDEETTPNLTNIQCENCHGPGSHHVGSGGDKTKILTGDQVMDQPQICGQCHTGAYHGTYEEWARSPHAQVTETVAEEFEANPNVYLSCGACHSGVVRRAMMAGGSATAVPASVAAHSPLTCVVCHAAHKKTQHPASLRYPTSSINFYSLDRTRPQWDSTVQVCGQCHNARAAAWQASGRPPHHSPQYNMLIGDFGPESVSGFPVAPAAAQSSHRLIEGQCTHCHMYSQEPDHSTGAAGLFGHTFRVDLRACSPCHNASDAGARRASTMQDLIQRMSALQARLDAWAKTSPLYAKYGTRAWEYTVPGAFGNPTGDPSLTGPTSAEQASIPAAVKKARFALYLVLHDGSYGVHNAKYARWLLDQGHAALTAAGIP